jgi:hypothetical protein
MKAFQAKQSKSGSTSPRGWTRRSKVLISLAGIVILSLALAGIAYAFSVGNVDGVWGDIDGVTAGPGTQDVIGGATTSGSSATLYPTAADHTYVRKAATCRGDADGDTTFADWTSGSLSWAGLGSHTSTCSPMTGLIISEYVYDQRSNSNNDRMCVEIYNGTGATVALGNYSLRFFSGGRNSFDTVALTSANLVNNDVWVFCNTNGADQTTAEDQTWSNTSDSWRTVALFNENETAGARCNRWATGPGDAPTALSSGDKGVQTGPTSDENQVRYGRDAFYPSDWQSLSCDLTNFAEQSGFGFDGSNGPVSPAAGTPFYLGKFTHYNNQVFSTNDNYDSGSANAFTDVNLTVTVPVTCNDGTTSTNFSFDALFTLDETSNTAGECAYPGTSVCPDKVTVTQPTTSAFTCPDGSYTVNILGFTTEGLGGDPCDVSFNDTAVSTDYITEEDTDNVACLWAEIAVPTAVTASPLSASAADKAIRISWETYSEKDIVDFSLYRAAADGARSLIYQTPAQHPGELIGASYEYADASVLPGVTYTYWLEVRLNNGSTETLDPASANLPGAMKVFLPSIRR